MKKTLLGLLLSTSVLAVGAVSVSADINTDTPSSGQTTYVGESTGKIDVTGTLGVTNTDPDAPIDEGDTAWVNVTVPTKTVFYSGSKSANAPITSPVYNITNNSGRPVTVTFSSFTDSGVTQPTTGERITGATTASVNLKANLGQYTTATFPNTTTVDTAVITDGAAVNPTGSITLANTEGKMTSTGTADTNTKVLTFAYRGSIGATGLSGMLTSNYELGLTFSVPTTPAWK